MGTGGRVIRLFPREQGEMSYPQTEPRLEELLAEVRRLRGEIAALSAQKRKVLAECRRLVIDTKMIS